MGKKDKKDKKNLDKKSKKKSQSKKKKETDNVSENARFSMPKTQSFQEPEIINLPPFLRKLVNHIQRDAGVNFNVVNVRTVGLDEIHELPTELLEHILKNALSDENYELATIVRDAIKNKEHGE
jgi:hypothetical protein